MAPSASKQKRLAEKAAKKSAGINDPASSSTTPSGSTNGSAINTPLTSMSAATSTDDIPSMAKLSMATDRSVFTCQLHLNIDNRKGAQRVSWFPISKVVM